MIACIISQEDHGFSVSFGINGISGFLHNKEVDGNSEYSILSMQKTCADQVITGNLKPGHLIYCSVTSVNEARRVVSVSLQQSVISTSQPKLSDNILLESLTPGLLVPAKIRHITSNGLVLSFFGIFEGTVDMFHTDKRLASLESDLEAKFKVDQKVRFGWKTEIKWP